MASCAAAPVCVACKLHNSEAEVMVEVSLVSGIAKGEPRFSLAAADITPAASPGAKVARKKQV